MDRYNLGEERLIAPDKYTSAGTTRNNNKDLVPPSHFESSAQLAHKAVQIPGTLQSSTWINSRITSEDPRTPSPWLANSQAKQEIMELRKENQRLVMLLKEKPREHLPVSSPSESKTRCDERSKQWFRWESDWRLEAEKHKEEAERLKRQVEVLKTSVERQWEEIKDRDNTMKRQIGDLEAMHEELSKTKSALSQTRGELLHCSAQKEKIGSQLERLRGESAEENTKLRRDAERSKEAARDCALRAEMCRSQAEESAKQQALTLSEQLSELHKKHEVELQLLSASHQAELATLRKTNNELQGSLESMASELLQLRSTLTETAAERDGLKQHLSQMRQAFEKQSATLHSLRNYIGQLAPESGEKEQLSDAVEKLNKEKAALQMTNELLTVRFNSVNEILTLQEEEMVKKTLTDPLVRNSSEGLQVLHLWREKVFKLCVQLRTKDIEVKEQKDKLISKIISMERALQQEQHRACVLQHSLDDRIAELDLERVAQDTLKHELAFGQKENSKLKSQNQKAEAKLAALTEVVHRFSQAFESKMADVDYAITRLNSLTQRLAFAKGRVETVQGLMMRKNALQKVQQAEKQPESTTECVTKLQLELRLVHEERDKLAKELKRTPELIETTVAQLREQYESKLRHRQQELEQSWVEVRRAAAGREQAEHNLGLIQAQLGECRVNLEEVSRELLQQQERSNRALLERVSEIENRCAEKLREMEFRVDTAKKEHTKAVRILRQFERQAARKTDEPERTRRETRREMETDKKLHQTSVGAAAQMCEHTRSQTANSEGTSSGTSRREEAGIQPPAHERFLSVLEELQTLSAAVMSSSEDSEEEEEEEDAAQDDGQPVHFC